MLFDDISSAFNTMSSLIGKLNTELEYRNLQLDIRLTHKQTSDSSDWQSLLPHISAQQQSPHGCVPSPLLFTLYRTSHAWPLHHPYPQRLGLLSCWNTALQPNFRRDGIMLCFSTSQYMLAFTVPSMNCSNEL